MPWRGAVVACAFFGALALAQCNNDQASPTQSSGDAQPAADAPPAPTYDAQPAPPDPTTPPPIDAGDVPVVQCGPRSDSDAGDGGDAGDAVSDPRIHVDPDAGECGFPPSICADGHWLVYYDYGTCVGGSCQWAKQYLYCHEGCTGGFRGECIVSLTADPGPPPH
jgi:hypothetical protein